MGILAPCFFFPFLLTFFLFSFVLLSSSSLLLLLSPSLSVLITSFLCFSFSSPSYYPFCILLFSLLHSNVHSSLFSPSLPPIPSSFSFLSSSCFLLLPLSPKPSNFLSCSTCLLSSFPSVFSFHSVFSFLTSLIIPFCLIVCLIFSTCFDFSVQHIIMCLINNFTLTYFLLRELNCQNIHVHTIPVEILKPSLFLLGLNRCWCESTW